MKVDPATRPSPGRPTRGDPAPRATHRHVVRLTDDEDAALAAAAEERRCSPSTLAAAVVAAWLENEAT